MKTSTIAASLGPVLIAAIIGVGAVIAQPAPKVNTSKTLHPNLNKAQKQLRNASESITMAQQANEWDLAGHAAKAKQLIDEADNELKLAAEQSNANKKKQ